MKPIGALIIFLKAPVAGRAKTRLGGGLGDGRAAALFRVMTRHTIARARRGPWRTILAVDPPSAAGGYGNLWPAELERHLQAKGDLGARQRAALAAAPPGPVVVIAADTPQIETEQIRAGFDALRGADAVFGPASDGGYWMLGLARRRPAHGLFDGVRWSTRHALADTRASMPASFRVRMLQTMQDIDTTDDLHVLGGLATRASAARSNLTILSNEDFASAPKPRARLWG